MYLIVCKFGVFFVPNLIVIDRNVRQLHIFFLVLLDIYTNKWMFPYLAKKKRMFPYVFKHEPGASCPSRLRMGIGAIRGYSRPHSRIQTRSSSLGIIFYSPSSAQTGNGDPRG